MDEAGEDGKLLASTLSFPEVQATQSTLGRERRRRGASLSREASCIFLYLSTKSHKRWPVARLQTFHKKHPIVNKRGKASTYHINTANQIYIYSSLTLKT